jgi:hypothetical protein
MRTLQLGFEQLLNGGIRPSRGSAWATTKCLLWCGKRTSSAALEGTLPAQLRHTWHYQQRPLHVDSSRWPESDPKRRGSSAGMCKERILPDGVTTRPRRSSPANLTAGITLYSIVRDGSHEGRVIREGCLSRANLDVPRLVVRPGLICAHHASFANASSIFASVGVVPNCEAIRFASVKC